MKVSDVMTRQVRMANPDQTLQEAARLMAEIDAGFLPVADGDRLAGTLTDRDIAVRGVAEGLGPDTRVSQIMSDSVKYCYEDQDIDEVCQNLGELQVRRLPVMNRDKRLVGVLSLGDIALADSDGSAGAALSKISSQTGRESRA